MNKFKINLVANGSIDDITNALRSIADAIEDAKGEHESAILGGVDETVWEIDNASFNIDQIKS
jgi:hypothetical protein